MSGRDPTDFFAVLPQHTEIHARLENWRRYVCGGTLRAWGTQPMFQGYRPSEVWSASETRIVDQLDGHKLEKIVGQLPTGHRDALRWHYCFFWINPHKVCRHLGVSKTGLAELIHAGRSMVKNRSTV